MGSSREDLSSSWMAATQSGAVTFDLFGILVPTVSMLELDNGMATATQRTSAKMVSVCGWTPSPGCGWDVSKMRGHL